MAVDTAEKRFSMLNFGDGTTTHLLPEPDGSIDLDDRQHLLDCYAGIAFDPPVGGPPAEPYLNLDANPVKARRQQHPLHDY